jgi:aspartyl-tRNA(Asn)/glutamyl-tRNA(Gln) amidotransferase subunit A
LRDQGALTTDRVAAAVLEQIERLQPLLNCYITLCPELAHAATGRQARDDGVPSAAGPVSINGIPLALKDNIATAGVRTTAGSKILAEYVPGVDATAWAKLRAAGAILAGKTNMDEFAFVPTGQNPHYGAIKNPWDVERIAGGSSGGSAAAVAAGMATAALGSDAGGSIRIPSAFCGVVGLKPTYGLVAQRGMVASGNPGIDHVGPIARSVVDAAILLDHMAGPDPDDPTSNVPGSREPGAYARAAARGAAERRLAGVRIGVPSDCYFVDLHPGVETAVREAIAHLAGLGAEVHSVALPDHELLMDGMSGLNAGEWVATHSQWMRTRLDEYSREAQVSLLASQLVPASDYAVAARARRLLRQRYDAVLADVDLLVGPTVRVPAPRATDLLDEGSSPSPSPGQRVSPGGFGRNTRGANRTGLPALTLPCGWADGMPVGLMLVGRSFGEEQLLAAASAYEATTEWHRARPSCASQPSRRLAGAVGGASPAKR